MLEMTVIISAFPYTSKKIFHLPSGLILGVTSLTKLFIRYISHFSNDIFNFELSITDEIFQIHQR